MTADDVAPQFQSGRRTKFIVHGWIHDNNAVSWMKVEKEVSQSKRIEPLDPFPFGFRPFFLGYGGQPVDPRRLQRPRRRLGSRLGAAVHQGRGQHASGRPGDRPPGQHAHSASSCSPSLRSWTTVSGSRPTWQPQPTGENPAVRTRDWPKWWTRTWRHLVVTEKRFSWRSSWTPQTVVQDRRFFLSGDPGTSCHYVTEY